MEAELVKIPESSEVGAGAATGAAETRVAAEGAATGFSGAGSGSISLPNCDMYVKRRFTSICRHVQYECSIFAIT